MIWKFECFWPNVEMMTWQHGARNSRFWENSSIKVYLTSKFLLLLSSIFLSPLVHEIQVWVLFQASFRLMTSPRWDKTSKILSEEFHKRTIHFKGPFTSDFHLSISIGALNTNFDLLTHFWVDCITMGSQKRILYLKFPYTTDFHLSINTGIWNKSLGPFWQNFGLMTSPGGGGKQTPHFYIPLNIDLDLSFILDT